MNSKAKRLGEFLQAAREGKNLTLRAVEKVTGISNSYLSQLEGGRIQQPSPGVLHKLSELYETSYVTLMKLARYPIPDSSDSALNYTDFASRIGPITKKEEDELITYLEFLRSRHKRRGQR